MRTPINTASLMSLYSRFVMIVMITTALYNDKVQHLHYENEKPTTRSHHGRAGHNINHWQFGIQ